MKRSFDIIGSPFLGELYFEYILGLMRYNGDLIDFVKILSALMIPFPRYRDGVVSMLNAKRDLIVNDEDERYEQTANRHHYNLSSLP
jgi:hypothetical protein